MTLEDLRRIVDEARAGEPSRRKVPEIIARPGSTRSLINRWMSDSTLTARAEADLFDIAVSGYRQSGIRQTEASAGGLEHIFQLLADNPRMGRTAAAIRPGVHRHEYAAPVILSESSCTSRWRAAF